jgi:exosortase
MNSNPMLTRFLPGLLLGTGLVMLVAVQPYAAGYGQFRVTLLDSLTTRWGDATWQHGALAPLIAGFLLWKRRSEFAQLPTRSNPWGFALIALALFFYFAGFKANNYYLGFASIQLLVAGAIVWLWGLGHFRLALFPWLILAFAWPLVFLEDTLAFQLRLVVLEGVARVLNVLQVPTVRDGTALISGASESHEVGALFRLQVDGPCSGMRSLFALMLVGALFGYFRQPTLGRRLTLFAATIPLAILANMVRVLLLVAASALFGQEFAVGTEEQEVSTFHFLSGIAVFVVALGGLQAVSALIDRAVLIARGRSKSHPDPDASVSASAPHSPSMR